MTQAIPFSVLWFGQVVLYPAARQRLPHSSEAEALCEIAYGCYTPTHRRSRDVDEMGISSAERTTEYL